jgi:hypothetical protein
LAPTRIHQPNGLLIWIMIPTTKPSFAPRRLDPSRP